MTSSPDKIDVSDALEMVIRVSSPAGAAADGSGLEAIVGDMSNGASSKAVPTIRSESVEAGDCGLEGSGVGRMM